MFTKIELIEKKTKKLGTVYHYFNIEFATSQKILLGIFLILMNTIKILLRPLNFKINLLYGRNVW